MHYQKRPELISHVEEFYRMYQSLADRYDNVTGELRKNIPSDLQSQGSGISEVGTELTPSSNSRSQYGTRAAGFDFFRKSGGSGSDLGPREGDETSTSDDSSANNYSSAFTNNDHRGLHKRITEMESELKKIKMKQEEKSKINNMEEDELRVENENLKQKHVLAQKEISSWKSKLEKEKREVLKLQDRITRYKTNLSDRDRETRAMRETLSNVNKTLAVENMQLEEQVTKLSKERVLLEDTIKEWDLRCQCSDEERRRMKIVKTEMEDEIEKLKFENSELVLNVNELDHELTLKDNQIDGLGQHLARLRLEHIELFDQVEKSKESIHTLTSRSEELEKESLRQQEVIEEQAEEKREVIRQLCFSLEHYKDGYQMMRQAFMGHNKRHEVMAS
ncbi:hypothetical protein QVD17_15564 [Tagetes erecta]|uniref:NAB domain-containing protein n=1 Tax=Tagetes erecta TaxID=13708 RepID=A0AAD8KPF4_TARER|nr:hypothetical protein QVD17_15564 [Tagetes erecta]